MSAWKCPTPPRIPRAALRGLAALVFGVSVGASVVIPAGTAAALGKQGILPPDAAARSYEAGREAIKKGDYALAVKRLEEALATGHTQPVERLGTTRNFVDRYDPDYWLGVAYMELGDKASARAHLEKSRSYGAIRRWPEYSDLTSRLALLQEKPPEEPTPEPTLPPPPVNTPAAPTPVPTPTARPIPIPPSNAPTPIPIRNDTDTPQRAATPAPRPLEAQRLEELLAALSHADWRAFEDALARARAAVPDALETPLLEAVGCANRYLLEGEKDAALLARARQSLAAYRNRGGSKRVEKLFLSPALERIL